MSERKQLIESAVKFLALPQVQSKSLQQKVEFLNSKGLSKFEIEEALKQVEEQEPPVRRVVEEKGPSLSSQSEKATHENEAWETAQFLSLEDSTLQPSFELRERSRFDSWRDAISLAKPEKKHWKSYLTLTVSALGGVYGMYELVKSFGSKAEGPNNSSDVEDETKSSSRKHADLQLNGTSFNPTPSNTAEQLVEVTSQTAALKECVKSLSASVKSLQVQESARDQEFKSLSRQLDELQHSIPQMLETQKSAQYAMVAGLHDDLKALKGLLIRRNTPASSPQISAAQTPTQAQPNPFIPSPLATK